MLLQIFLFEIKYRLRRPAFYIYFLCALLFVTLNFGHGAVPAEEKEMVNAPAVLAVFSCAASLFLMLVSSSIMGVPLYRDIEHNTKEYYLSYPITKAGYFWGRWLGSFFFVMLVSMAVMLGAWLGSQLGPALGWTPAGRYGPDKFYYYLYPWLTLVLPNIFFTSCLFFGLVAIFRNVKVIYSSGMFLFLGYILSNFFLSNINNPRVIYLADPFLLNGLRAETAAWSPAQLNTSVIHLQGLMLTNRIIWISVGALILLLTYLRFSFERFFSGAHGRRTAAPGTTAPIKRNGIRAVFRNVQVQLEGSYLRKTWSSLTRIELLNIIRDNYFWIILSGGLIFLSFVFYHGPGGMKVRDYPRAAFFMDVFTEVFGNFVFFIIIFYTGETVHRERHTRFAFINDALPPPTWILNLAKLSSLCCLGIFLSLVPILVGLGVQLSRSFYYFNFPLYFTAWGSYLLPQMLEMVLFSYALHNLVNNKFAAHAIGITLWVFMIVAADFHYFNYNLLLYGHSPDAIFTDMDGIGHILRPLLWFQSYWLAAGVVLVFLASLFYVRGVSTTFKEKKQLALQRFQGSARSGAFLSITVFLAIGAYIYYNVSYLNEYLTPAESNERKAIAERQLKRYNELPLPRITSLRLTCDLYPSDQKATTKAWLTITNKGDKPIDSLLLDGDGLTYDLLYNDQFLSYRNPLSFPRGKFNFLRPAKEPSDYRLYVLPDPLLPGDTAALEIHSQRSFDGFQNDLYGLAMLRNGFVFNGGLPALGYDDGEELANNDDRRKFGLPEKHEADIPHDDPAGRRSLESGFNADLVTLDITVSTAGDQWAIAPGTLENEWSSGGRHYFHYVQDHPRLYLPSAMASARYAIRQDTTILENGKPVNLQVVYHPAHKANVPRFMAALKDGIRSYSRQFGPYPFGQMRLAEISFFGPSMSSFCQTILNTERVGWNADMREPGLPDNIYYTTAVALAEQWWGQTVAPNHTVGSQIISKGLSQYSALMLVRKKYGEDGLNEQLQREKNDYGWGRRTHYTPEHDLLHANQWYQFGAKTALVLYGLQGLVGEDSVNAALRSFRDQYAFRDGGYYAGSEDLYRALEAHTPDSLRYFLEDSWKKVCLYNNRIVDVSAAPLRENKFKVTLKLELQKSCFDSTGTEHAAPMNDYIDIAIYGKAPLYLQRHRLTAGLKTLEIIVEGKPSNARIDPHTYLMDTNQEDNRKMIP
ncbi:hypothetical protein Q4E93_32455 [Flavitalea sp. BT771]|uniref:ABC transporter permease/M1 family aminopeptidase n=1 Tax=Flavitalea sp. BT771 TaxID=3063329 RepID=UPI0026E2BCC6|nr:hypothetical protein [Flavitalea sp. BT771]MDO6435373.1 hypothetical protein [Flavitalea sp. BT771]MDV6224267.1 hypothetical protein [Flavitalea sp. BT771]